MSDAKLYVVKGVQQSLRSTYNCPTAETALKKLRDFIGNGYTEISCTSQDGQSVTEAELASLVERAPAGGAPIDVDAPNALALIAYA